MPGGKDMQVTNENVISFIHLLENHILNSQIRNQRYSLFARISTIDTILLVKHV